MIFRAAALSAVLLTAAAPATAQTAPKPEAPRAPCFRLSDLGGHKIAAPDTLYYSVRRKEVYKFTFSGSCLAGVTNSDPLILEPLGASSQICKPLDLNLGVGGAGLAPVHHQVDRAPDPRAGRGPAQEAQALIPAVSAPGEVAPDPGRPTRSGGRVPLPRR